jgi:L-threonylcarbamoyladenylate synthase
VEHRLTPESVAAFERCIRDGGVAVFPADTVYGLACDPDSASAIERMYALKGRSGVRPSAVMFFSLEDALAALPDLGEITVAALRRLLPGPVTAVVPSPAGRFALATGDRGLGLRVPRLEGALAPLADARVPVLQTSANETGEPDARRVSAIPAGIQTGVDMVLDGGDLSGTPSTVIDLTAYETDGSWELLREAAVDRAGIAAVLNDAT